MGAWVLEKMGGVVIRGGCMGTRENGWGGCMGTRENGRGGCMGTRENGWGGTKGWVHGN